MKNLFALIFALFIFSFTVYSQQEPVVKYFINVSDNDGGSKDLPFGLDPTAGDSVDYHLGEADLPPFPPAGAFEARFCLPADNFSGIESSYQDYRHADFPFTGQVQHQLWYQPGTGTAIIVSWNFPDIITGRLQDIITGTLIDIPMSGTGSYTVDNPAGFNRLKLTLNYDGITEVDEAAPMPSGFRMEQNYPNPFNPSTNILFALDKSSYITITVYDIMGNKVKALVEGNFSAGEHVVPFNAAWLASGVYYYQLASAGKTITKKMILIR